MYNIINNLFYRKVDIPIYTGRTYLVPARFQSLPKALRRKTYFGKKSFYNLYVTAELDESVEVMGGMLKSLVKLAEVEKTCNMLAIEIEKNVGKFHKPSYHLVRFIF